MATIHLTDQIGLDLDAKAAPFSALAKYVQQLPALRLDALDLSKIGGLTLNEPAVRSLATGITFDRPIALGDGAREISVEAGAHGSLRIVDDASDLPGDVEDETAAEACYVALTVEANASAELSGTVAGLTFGASPGVAIELESYSRFPLKANVTLLQAIQQTVSSFSLPLAPDDLTNLPDGHIVRAALHGTLTLSGSADLLATTNPLASVTLPSPLPVLSVTAGGSATVAVSCRLEADYEIVACKLANGAVRLGWYRGRQTDVTVSGKVSEGISAGFGETDLFSQIVRVISADPKADLDELTAAGLPAEQVAAIQSAVSAAAARKLEIAVGAQFSVGSRHTASFLYDITPAALTDESRKALTRALDGDLTAVHALGLPGVTCVRSIWDDVRSRGLELEINLLGVFNFRSIASLTLAGKVLVDTATGDLVITDKATAERIRSAQLNFGADTQKLRNVLAESFLLTAVYRSVGDAAISLRCTHSFFELDSHAHRAEVAHHLRAGTALGLLSAEEASLPTGSADFGRTLFQLTTEYDDALVRTMFVDANGAALPLERYEAAGRAALACLIADGDDDAARRRPALDDGLWARMKETGQPGFHNLLPGVPAPLVGAITADYSCIRWWADAMRGAALQVAEIQAWLAGHPAAALREPEFLKQRDRLAGYLRFVADNTHEEFGQPWGLLAMSILSGRKSGARVLLSSPTLVRSNRRALAAVQRT